MCQNCFLPYDRKNQQDEIEKEKMISAGFVLVFGGINNLKKIDSQKNSNRPTVK